MSDVYNYDYNGNPQTFTVPKRGFYSIECWGAQGGGNQKCPSIGLGVGGLGGYASGIFFFEKNLKLFVYVGGSGNCIRAGLAKGGFNGGGSAYGSGGTECAAGGGGASDVRLINQQWDSPESLLSRLIVAGGGGGGGEDDSEFGGFGGGATNGVSKCIGCSVTGGVFGKGAHTPYDGGGGGGGWIGGSTSGGSQTIPTSNSDYDTNGGYGGSGWVFSENSQLVDGYLVDKKYQSRKSNLIGGTSMPLPDGSTGNGKSGHGYVRIRLVIAIEKSIRRRFSCYYLVSHLVFSMVLSERN